MIKNAKNHNASQPPLILRGGVIKRRGKLILALKNPCLSRDFLALKQKALLKFYMLLLTPNCFFAILF